MFKFPNYRSILLISQMSGAKLYKGALVVNKGLLLIMESTNLFSLA